MKTQLVFFSIIISIITTKIQAQNRTIVNAVQSEISDNLDLRAISSIFGESNNLQDFERRLNDPNLQISNLDLNNDNQVDYLRVIEYVKNRIHVIVIQSVLGRDLFQDIATIELEKDNYNTVHLQVVGDPYIYGQNYIYEPIYYNTPLIYATFWSINYNPYRSIWGWNYYPNYYYSWNTFPVYRYKSNINIYINQYNTYTYVSNRRSTQAEYFYNSRRMNGYEKQYPNYSFSKRNTQFENRHLLDQRRYFDKNSRKEVNYSQNRNQKVNSEKINETNKTAYQNKIDDSRINSRQTNQPQRVYSQIKTDNSRVNSNQRNESPKFSNKNRNENLKSDSNKRKDSRSDISYSSRNENRR